MDRSESVMQDVPDPSGAFDKSGDAIQVASRVAHEFNNLLTSILGHCALVRPEVAEDGISCLDQVDKAAHRAADLSRQLQAYAGQQGAPPMDRTHVYQIVNDMGPLLKAIVRGRIRLELDLDADTPAVDVEATSLRHLMVHFVLGAVSAAGDAHATITVRTCKASLGADEAAELRSAKPLAAGDFVCLDLGYVRHDETALTHSLDRLLTPRGLPMVHALAGGMVVRALPDGEEVRVALRTAVDLAQASGWGSSGEFQPTQRLILVVDDERPVRDLVKDMLEMAGMHVITAVDGRDAIQLFLRHRGSVAGVVMDLRMPNMDGAQAARELLALQDDLPIVLSSGYEQDPDLDSLFGLSHVAFLPKPYTHEELLEALQASLSGGAA